MKPGGRRSIRLPHYDYSQAGVCFVTICVDKKARHLGTIENDAIVLSQAGVLVQNALNTLPTNEQAVAIDIACIMPNHLHFLLSFIESKQEFGRGGVTPPLHLRQTLGQIIAKFKYATTKDINELQSSPGAKFWQRNYYERIIRNETEYAAVYNYILDNPRNWDKDEYARQG